MSNNGYRRFKYAEHGTRVFWRDFPAEQRHVAPVELRVQMQTKNGHPLGGAVRHFDLEVP